MIDLLECFSLKKSGWKRLHNSDPAKVEPGVHPITSGQSG